MVEVLQDLEHTLRPSDKKVAPKPIYLATILQNVNRMIKSKIEQGVLEPRKMTRTDPLTKIKTTYHDCIGSDTLSRYLDMAGWSFGSMKHDMLQMRETHREYRCMYILIKRQLRPLDLLGKVVYLDETSLYANMTARKSWAPTNNRHMEARAMGKGKSVTVIGAGTASGWIRGAFAMISGGVNSVKFFRWCNELLAAMQQQGLLPNTGVVIVLDNAPTHTSEDPDTKPPGSADTKQVIYNFLCKHFYVEEPPSTSRMYDGPTDPAFKHWYEQVLPDLEKEQELPQHLLPYKPAPPLAKLSKSMLLDAIKQVRAQRTRRTTRYKIDSFFRAKGYEVLRLPPYHCNLNPIELFWNTGKGTRRLPLFVDVCLRGMVLSVL